MRSKSAPGPKSPPTNQKAPWPTWISWATSSLARKVCKHRLQQLLADLFPLILFSIYTKQEWRHLPVFTCDFENCIFIKKASLFVHSIRVISAQRVQIPQHPPKKGITVSHGLINSIHLAILRICSFKSFIPKPGKSLLPYFWASISLSFWFCSDTRKHKLLPQTWGAATRIWITIGFQWDRLLRYKLNLKRAQTEQTSYRLPTKSNWASYSTGLFFLTKILAESAPSSIMNIF